MKFDWRALMRGIGEFFAMPFRWIGAGVMWAVNFNADQIRALMCWAMLGGIAVLGFTNIGQTFAAHDAVQHLRQSGASFDQTPYLDLLIEQIRYNSILQALMIAGVVMIAIQANSFKAKVGDLIDIDATLKDAAQQAAKEAIAKEI